jgi:transcriptional regulator with XRE-family HTH domain
MRELAQLIRTRRIKQGFKTAKQFWSHVLNIKGNEGWISYAYYQQIETARRHPPVKLLLELSQLLDIETRQACYLYARALMPDERTKSYFEITEKNTANQDLALLAKVSDKWDGDEVVNLGDRLLSFFTKSPLAYEVFCVLTSTINNNLQSIGRLLGIQEEKVQLAFRHLQEMNLIQLHGDQAKLTNVAFRFHGNQTNKDQLWTLFARHTKILNDRAFDHQTKSQVVRASALIPLTPEGTAKINKTLKDVLTEFYSLDDTPSSRTSPHYLGLLFGPRYNSVISEKRKK